MQGGKQKDKRLVKLAGARAFWTLQDIMVRWDKGPGRLDEAQGLDQSYRIRAHPNDPNELLDK